MPGPAHARGRPQDFRKHEATNQQLRVLQKRDGRVALEAFAFVDFRRHSHDYSSFFVCPGCVTCAIDCRISVSDITLRIW